MNHQHENYMKIAIDEAKAAMADGDLPFGAVVVCEGKVVGRGHAENNTTGDVTDHAEIRALRQACKNVGTNDLRKCVIYCSNEPCLMCAAAIFQADIPTVFIGVSRADVPHVLRPRKLSIEDLAKDSSYEIEIVRGLLKDEILPFFDNLGK